MFLPGESHGPEGAWWLWSIGSQRVRHNLRQLSSQQHTGWEEAEGPSGRTNDSFLEASRKGHFEKSR